MEELVQRAFAAYYRHSKSAGATPQQPSNDSGLVTFEEKDYVVLRNIRGILAVYRVRNDGILKRLTRWPKALNGEI